MDRKVLDSIQAELNERYPELGIQSIDVEESTGQASFYLSPKKQLAFLDTTSSVSPIKTRYNRTTADVITRSPVTRVGLDLLSQPDVMTKTPIDLIKRANQYHYTEPLVGSTNCLLASLAAKGFENDLDDDDIKAFYDAWAYDVNFYEVLEWIFLEFFKTGNVVTYKVLGKYQPKTKNEPGAPGKTANASKEYAAAKKKWAKSYIPTSYTILNPELLDIRGNLLFDKYSIYIKLPVTLKEVLDKPTIELSDEEKELIKSLPPKIKRAVQNDEDLLLDSDVIGTIFYRKQPYERYAKPRITRIFDSLEYKRSLREADLSTLDGISNYILKITIGSDEYPVTSQEELMAVAKLFDTPSKSFDVVWNHTLKIEKIVSPEIESILGQEKYAQVNDDITAGLAVTKALLDGSGDMNASEVALAIKGVTEEINYARRQVSRWIHNEYRQIAEAMGFDKFPKVRWDEGTLKDTIMYMSTLAQLVDRRMLSYRTALESLGFDFDNERNNLEKEVPLVQEGTFGLMGSPWQQTSTQPTQVAPTGTPSNGRPTGQPTSDKVNSSHDLKDIIAGMSDNEFKQFINYVFDIKTKN